MRKSEKFIYWVSEKTAILGTIVLIILMAMIVIDVFSRNIFNYTIVGAVELTEMMMPCIGFLGIAWCALQGGHVVVDILISALPVKTQRVFDGMNYVLGAAVTFLIGWYTLQQSIYAKQIRVVTESLDIPKYPFMLVTAIGFFLMTLASLTLLINSMKRTVEK
ncbi:MAG: TRAP transporter small permease [Firmicutes bacterium]|nr:TRAP transporter small permease [Bacillota bacterium]